MTHVWFIDFTLMEDAHNIIKNTKKGTATIKKLNTLCKKCKGLASSLEDLDEEVAKKYDNDPQIARIELTLNA